VERHFVLQEVAGGHIMTIMTCPPGRKIAIEGVVVILTHWRWPGRFMTPRIVYISPNCSFTADSSY
jgi:hypothetical protein